MQRQKSRRAAAPVKLTVPRIRNAYLRERLFKHLDAALPDQTVWVSGQPGAGKTTLLASYIAVRQPRCLWYQMDSGDVDLAGFFFHLALAAGQQGKRSTCDLPSLTAEYAWGVDVFARRFFDELNHRLHDPTLLVFDNVQECDGVPAVQEILAIAAERLPETHGLVLISRSTPWVNFARQRVYQQLLHLDNSALQLDAEEALAIAALHDDAPLSVQRQSAILEALTYVHGWAAGLTLLLKGDMPPSVEEYSSAEPTLLFEFFAAEVFDRMPAEAQAMLLPLAVVPHITEDLAGTLTDDATTPALLETLHRQNYFTLRQDLPAAYQFHPLFRAFLLKRALSRLGPQTIRSLRERAARRLELTGSRDLALAIYMEAEAWDEASRLILAEAPGLVAQGRALSVAAWIRTLPAAILAAEPWLHFWRGVCCRFETPREAAEDLRLAFDRFRDRQDLRAASQAWIAYSELGSFFPPPMQQWRAWLCEFDAWLEREPLLRSAAEEMRLLSALFGAALWSAPDYPKLHGWALQARELLTLGFTARNEPLDYAGLLTTAALLMLYYSWIGEGLKADSLLLELRVVFGHRNAPAVARIMYLQYLAANQWLTGAADQSIASVEAALALAADSGVHVWDCAALAHAVYANLLAGKLDAARESLRAFRATIPPFNHLQVQHYAYLRFLIKLHEGQAPVAEAREMLQQALLLETPWVSSLVRLVLVQAWIVEGNASQALSELRPCIELGERMQSRLLQGFCAYAIAQCAFLQQGCEDGLAQLQQALALSRDCNMPAVPWISRKRLADLYARSLTAGLEVPFVRQAIVKLKLAPNQVDAAPPAWPWPVKIHTLGRFEILTDDRPLDSKRKESHKVVELLKALVDLGGRNAPHYTLCEMLWPHTDGDKAAGNFKVTLHRLRELLGRADAVLQNGGCLSLNSDIVWVDISVLKRILRRLRRTPSPSTDEALWRAVEEVHAIYRGPYLPTDELPWTERSRETIRQEYLDFLRKVAQQFADHGNARLLARLRADVEEREPALAVLLP